MLQLEEEEEEEELEDKFDISVSVKDPEKIGGTLVMKKKPGCSPLLFINNVFYSLPGDGMNAYMAYKVSTQVKN